MCCRNFFLHVYMHVYMKNCSNLLITNFRVQIKVRQKNSEGELQEMTCEMNEELAIFLNSPNGGNVFY